MLLEEEPGFNVRDYTQPRYVDHIESLANQWAENPAMIPPLVIVIKDGHVYVRDGHCRRLGAYLAMERGTVIESIPCVMFRGNDADQAMLLLSSQSGAKLDYVEQAHAYERLVRLGVPEEVIAKKQHKSIAHIKMICEIAMLPVAMQNYITREVISYAEALRLTSKYGETKAVELVTSILAEKTAQIQGMLDEQAASADAPAVANGEQADASAAPATTEAEQPKAKVTRSDINKRLSGSVQRFTAKVKESTVSMVAELAKMVTEDDQPQTVTLTPELVAAILTLSKQFSAPAPTDGEQADGEPQGEELAA